MNGGFRLFPEQASRGSVEVDMLSLTILLVASLFTFGIAAAIVFFTLRFWHGRKVNRVRNISRLAQWGMELTWSGIPLVILMGLFFWGAKIYFHQQRPPRDTLDISVVAKQWMWKMGHEDGRREINMLHLPVGRDVRLTMISEDIIHSFYVPAFRQKQDVLPGRLTTVWFQPRLVGTYHLFCAEFCGTSHSQMIGQIVVLSPEDYAEWLQSAETPTAQQRGLRWLDTFGCLQCHGIPASEVEPVQVGPSLVGLYGHRVPLADGRTVTADEEYLLRAMLDPSAEIAAGFANRMPSFEGQIQPEQLLDIVAYLRSVADANGPLAGPSAYEEQ